MEPVKIGCVLSYKGSIGYRGWRENCLFFDHHGWWKCRKCMDAILCGAVISHSFQRAVSWNHVFSLLVLNPSNIRFRLQGDSLFCLQRQKSKQKNAAPLNQPTKKRRFPQSLPCLSLLRNSFKQRTQTSSQKASPVRSMPSADVNGDESQNLNNNVVLDFDVSFPIEQTEEGMFFVRARKVTRLSVREPTLLI